MGQNGTKRNYIQATVGRRCVSSSLNLSRRVRWVETRAFRSNMYRKTPAADQRKVQHYFAAVLKHRYSGCVVVFVNTSSEPVSFEVRLVSDQCDRPVVAAQPLVFTDDVQIPGSLVEAGSTHYRVDDDERAGPLQIPLRLLVRLYTRRRRNKKVVIGVDAEMSLTTICRREWR